MLLSSADRERLLRIESHLTELPFPPQLVVENTSYCNLRCAHCCHRELRRPQRHMARALWNKIVQDVGTESPDCELWPTFYGEALILGRSGELWSRLEYAAAVGCRNLVLNSNGTLLDRWNNYDRILASPLRRFILSLDGFSAETFEAIRVGANHAHVYRCVEELLNRKAQSNRPYPVIICQFSRMPANAEEVETFRAHWRARGAEVKIRGMLEWTASGLVSSEMIDHATDFRIACPWANHTMAIHQNGNVVACAVDYEGEFVVGNCCGSNLRELWMRLGDFRSAHRSHNWAALPPICQRCRDWQMAGAQYDDEEVPGTRPFWLER